MKIDIISAQGDPSNSKTWSSTPKNIMCEFQRLNALGSAFESGTNNIFYRLSKILLKIYYRLTTKKASISLLSRYWVRKLDSFSAIQFSKETASGHMLHFGTLSMPFFTSPFNQKHYLYTDGTWDLWSKYATDMDKITKRQMLITENLEKKSYEYADHIFSISEYVKDNLIAHYKVSPNKITVVGTGTGIIKPFYGIKKYDQKKILFVAKGRFEDKGGDLVLKSFYRALESFPDLHLSIVGQPDYSSIPVHPNITTYGFIPVEELQNIFNTHSLFLMPALNEPWGLVYIEAMLCKMPIMGLNRNSFPELSGFGNYGIGINEPDHILLASKIVELFKDPSKLNELGSKAQDFALKNFTWEKTSSNIFDKILSLNQKELVEEV